MSAEQKTFGWRKGGLLAAALLAAPVAAHAEVQTRTGGKGYFPTYDAVATLGEHRLFNTRDEAFTDKAIQEEADILIAGGMPASYRDAFVAAATAQRNKPGTTMYLPNGSQLGSMGYRGANGKPAVLGDGARSVKWVGKENLTGEKLEFIAPDGKKVTILFPGCFNVSYVGEETVAVTPPLKTELPPQRFEANKIPCADFEIVADKPLPPNARFKMSVVMMRAEAEQAGIATLAQCEKPVIPQACEEEACDLMELQAREIAIANRQNPNDRRVIENIARNLVVLVYEPKVMANGRLRFSVPAEFVKKGYICRLPELDRSGRPVTFGRIGVDEGDVQAAVANGVGRFNASIIKPSSVQPLRNMGSTGGMRRVDAGGFLTQTAPPAAAMIGADYQGGYRAPYSVSGPSARGYQGSGFYQEPRVMNNGRSVGGRIVGGVVQGLADGAYLGAREWTRKQILGDDYYRGDPRYNSRVPYGQPYAVPRGPMGGPMGGPQGAPSMPPGSVYYHEEHVRMGGGGSNLGYRY